MKQPIFIIGCPRSGTTLILNIMACHEQFAWISNLIERWPFRPQMSFWHRIYDLPYMGRYLYLGRTQNRLPKILFGRFKNYLPMPVESKSFWKRHLSKFQWEREGKTPPRRRTPNEISMSEISNIRRVIDDICRFQSKDFFVAKYTDFPRIQYLAKAFQKAKFIHVIRDGRAVANSYLQKIKNGDFKTWHEREWWIKGWPATWCNKWLQRYKTPLSFVVFQWKFFVSEIWKDSKTISKEQYLEVNYKDIIDSPQRTFQFIFEFCGLKTSQKVKWYLDRIALQNMNRKWEEKLTDKEKEVLDEIICEPEFKSLLDY